MARVGGSGATMTAVMTGSAPLYVRVIGDSWAQIAEPIRRVHGSHAIVRASGHLRVEDGRHVLARVLARILRLPRPTAAAETQLMVTAGPDGEHWQRTFNGRHFEDTAVRIERIRARGTIRRPRVPISTGRLWRESALCSA